MDDLKIFTNEQFGSVRTVNEDGNLWFCGKDVLNALEYKEGTAPAKAFQIVPSDWKGVKPIHTPGGEQELLFVSEQGLYLFLGRSDKKKAIPYQRYIAGDVVPSIRKHGVYMTDDVLQKALSDPRSIAKILNDLADEREARLAAESKIEKLEAENAVMAPKADYFDDLVDRNLNTNFRTTAKEFQIGEKKFIRMLEKHGYIYKDYHGNRLPYAARNNGLFVVKECKGAYSSWAGTQTLITPKVRETFRLLVKQWKNEED